MGSIDFDGPQSLSTVSLVRSGSSTGVYSGGVLSVGSPTTTFSISDGAGVIAGDSIVTDVSWSGQTNLSTTFLATNLISFVSIDAAGDVIQRATRWTSANARDEIILGVLVHVNLTNLDTVNNEQRPSRNVGAQLGDLMAALGFMNGGGNIISSSGADLTIDKSLGTIIGPGVNYAVDVDTPHVKTLAALTNASFQYRFQDGSNGATGTSINPNIYDVAGTSTAVPTNKFTVQHIYSFTSNNVKIQPGQELFNSLSDAELTIPHSGMVIEPSIASNGLLIGFLTVQEGCTDLTQSTQAAFYQADRHGQGRL